MTSAFENRMVLMAYRSNNPAGIVFLLSYAHPSIVMASFRPRRLAKLVAENKERRSMARAQAPPEEQADVLKFVDMIPIAAKSSCSAKSFRSPRAGEIGIMSAKSACVLVTRTYLEVHPG